MDITDAFYLLHHALEKVVTDGSIRDKPTTLIEEYCFLGCSPISSLMLLKNILP
jgi:hypothetical protein